MDLAQGNFSIDHDTRHIIPLVLRAQQAAGGGGGLGVQFVASPWSPPGWMKVPYGLDKSKVMYMCVCMYVYVCVRV